MYVPPVLKKLGLAEVEENPRNNRYQVAAEVSIERTGTTQTKRCDIVGFVNGIPFLVIENKRPTETLKRAASQLIGYQSDDNIPHLFHFAQVLVTMNRQDARYATVGTPAARARSASWCRRTASLGRRLTVSAR